MFIFMAFLLFIISLSSLVAAYFTAYKQIKDTSSSIFKIIVLAVIEIVLVIPFYVLYGIILYPFGFVMALLPLAISLWIHHRLLKNHPEKLADNPKRAVALRLVAHAGMNLWGIFLMLATTDVVDLAVMLESSPLISRVILMFMVGGGIYISLQSYIEGNKPEEKDVLTFVDHAVLSLFTLAVLSLVPVSLLFGEYVDGSALLGVMLLFIPVTILESLIMGPILAGKFSSKDMLSKKVAAVGLLGAMIGMRYLIGFLL